MLRKPGFSGDRGDFPCPSSSLPIPSQRVFIISKPLRISPMGVPGWWTSCLSNPVSSAGQEVGLGIQL